jgi:hypothetical protein
MVKQLLVLQQIKIVKIFWSHFMLKWKNEKDIMR